MVESAPHMTESKPRVGIVGCGGISKSYLTNIQRHGVLDIVAVADLDMERAKAKATEYKIPRALKPEELLADPEVEYVLNLTVPQAHCPVAMAALANGKHVYNEKPLGVSRHEAELMCKTAKAKALRLGAAPDTVLGGGMQAARKLLDAGKIGEPFNVEVVFNLHAYNDLTHFHWKKGGGVLMDIGPYYFAAMVMLLGPVKRVAAFARYSPRPDLKAKFPNWKELIEVPSHTSAILDFASGVVGNVTITTEACGWYDVLLKIYGTEATLICPDPNSFHGDAIVTAFGQEKERIKTEESLFTNGRGAGLADMALAQRAGRPHRLSSEFAYHVLDTMLAVGESAEQGCAVTLKSTCERPAPFEKFE